MLHLQRVILVHYHEIGLKGRNRYKFEDRLIANIKSLTGDMPVCAVHKISGRILVFLKEGIDRDVALNVFAFLKKIPGVARVSLGFKCKRDYDVMKQAAVYSLQDCGDFKSFKVQARRNHTDFEIDSMQMNKDIGAACCTAFPEKSVKMKDMDIEVRIEVIQNMCFVCAYSKPGIGGLPVGSSGKVVSMLSSGIDSPVASWRMARRGAEVIGVHFSGRPQTSDASEYLVEDIAHVLNETGCMKKFYVCPIGDYQREISRVCEPSLRVILYRRLMFRVAQVIAKQEGAGGLVTGESLGQVASQTLSNMQATNDAVDMQVLRPLVGFDKQEIIEQAEALGTFEISSQDAPDCCTLFMPRNPETHANLQKVRFEEAKLSSDSWVDDIIQSSDIHLL